MISIENVSKAYGNQKILDHVSFQIHKGVCTALIGRNGAGKSTLIDLLIGDRRLDDGQIIGRASILNKQRVGILFQKTAFPRLLKVKELFTLYQSFYDHPYSLEKFQQITRFDETKLKQMTSKLSGGELRILDFALSIMGDPDIVILDEPTAAMDTSMRAHFWRIVEEMKSEGKTILYTSHYIEEVEQVADRVIVLNKGKCVIDDTPYNIRNKQNITYIYIPLMYRDRIEGLSNVEIVEVGDRLKITTQNMNELIKKLMKTEVDLNTIEISKISLMDTFLQNTQRSDV
ncbi:ABC transporter ATP-binding protein [Staphylococcus sp. 17KM0847]|uniref:ABC transporter ATP-binding protein n=1 Tax=Staphylococcus sp. 17KM0847 TaxID=2583989 RepID=UPI0015DCF548|nr:ABC transporter ATP-binding protein [Staphylococcus sp. 17KM0847]QLK86413.1 ABC transporter ATP-binding protein [Staphylococcus sp. 17KM0847]